MEITDGRGVDLIVDVVGGSTLERGIGALAYLGRIVWAGNAGREDYQPNVWPIMQKNGSITGVFLGEEMRRHPERVRPMIERLLARVVSGELRVAIEQRYALAEAAEAHRFIESRQAFGRVLLIP